VSVSFLHPRHKEKDTSENIRATKGFTVNIISEPFVTNANYTSIDAPEDVDEWIGSGLTREPSVGSGQLDEPAPVLTVVHSDDREAPQSQGERVQHGVRGASVFSYNSLPGIQFIPQLFHLHDISPPGSSKVTGTIVLGHVKMFHVRNSVLNKKGTVETSALRPVSRLGALTYGRIGDSFDLPRVSWKEEQEAVQQLKERQ